MRHLLLSLLLLLAQSAAAQTSAARPPHTILVRGTTRQELEPEKLDLLLTYRFSDNVKEGNRAQDQELSLQQVIRQAGISPEKLVLEDLSASGYGGFSKTGNANVSLTKVYRLTIDAPRTLNELIPRLVQTGADYVRVTNLMSSRLAATKLDVASRALAEARQKAETVARQLGAQLASAVVVAEVVPNQGADVPESLRMYKARYSVEEAMQQGRSEEPTTPNLRKIVVEASYDVVYEVK